jgi:hypothetical protein
VENKSLRESSEKDLDLEIHPGPSWSLTKDWEAASKIMGRVRRDYPQFEKGLWHNYIIFNTLPLTNCE